MAYLIKQVLRSKEIYEKGKFLGSKLRGLNLEYNKLSLDKEHLNNVRFPGRDIQLDVRYLGLEF